MSAALNKTTLNGAIAKSALSLVYTGGTTPVVGYLALCEGEIMLITAVDSSTKTVKVQRGYASTEAVPHATLSTLWIDQAAYFDLNTPSGTATLANEPVLPRVVLPGPQSTQVRGFHIVNAQWVEVPTSRYANCRVADPLTGYEYLLCTISVADLVNGEFVVIDPDGDATALAATSKGRVGIMVEDVTHTATATSFVIVVGKYASAITTSDVTTAADLIAGTGCADILTSTGGNIIWGAACTVAPSTATSPTVGGGLATVYVNNPWVSGEIHSFSSVGT